MDPKKIKVLVSISLSKEVEIEVTDYTSEIEIDEDGLEHEICEFCNSDLNGAVEEQIDLPGKDWNRDELEVILNG